MLAETSYSKKKTLGTFHSNVDHDTVSTLHREQKQRLVFFQDEIQFKIVIKN